MKIPFKKQLLHVFAFVNKYVGVYQLRRYIKISRQLKLIIGASQTSQNGWFSTEQSFLDMTKIEHWNYFFKEDSITAMLAEHVFEHLEIEDAELALRNSYKFIKNNGYFRIAVPDGYHPDENYIDLVKVGGSGYGSDDHKVLYNYKTLSELLERVGFKVDLLEYFDENGVFHKNGWDASEGIIRRSAENDKRNFDHQLNYTSLIIDARKVNNG